MKDLVPSPPKVRVIKNPTLQEKLDRLVGQTEKNERLINQLGYMTAVLIHQLNENSHHD